MSAQPDPMLQAPSPAELLATLAQWAEQGWLRRLDAALARFVASQCPETTPPVLLATALVAHLEGLGHGCLPLADWLAAPQALLGWRPEAAAALQALLRRLPADARDWQSALLACTAVGLAPSPDTGEPLVWQAGRLYLRRYWRYEQRLAAQVLVRCAEVQAVAPAQARLWLDRLFPAPAPAAPDIDWQKTACAIALRGRLTVITGGPGTGKTYTAARLLALLLATAPGPLRVALAAPTGKAAARLQQSIVSALAGLQPLLGDVLGDVLDEALPLANLAAQIGPARTLHALLGARPGTRRLQHNAANPLALDLLIVDEASMVHLEMMAALLDALPPQARLVLLGDKDQLASVEAGAVLGDLCQHALAGRYQPQTQRYIEASTGQALPDKLVDPNGPALAQHTVMLRHSQRFGGAINALAVAVNAGDAAAAQRLLQATPDGPVHWLASATPAAVVALATVAVAGRDAAAGGYRDYLTLIRQQPADNSEAVHSHWVHAVLQAFDRFRVLCAVKDGDWGSTALNRAITQQLAQAGLLPARGEWVEGRPVLVTRNDPGLGVFNGDIGITLRNGPDHPNPAGLRAWFANGQQLRSVSVGRLADVETAFAMTVHKSQGSEFLHTVLVLPPDSGRAATRELVYTGITRARAALTLVCAQRDALVLALARSTRRASGLAALLDETADTPP